MESIRAPRFCVTASGKFNGLAKNFEKISFSFGEQLRDSYNQDDQGWPVVLI